MISKHVQERSPFDAAPGSRVLTMHSGAWYGDPPFSIAIPDAWDLDVFWPRTPPPMTPEDIVAALRAPAGQPPLRQLAAGSRKPVIVVDDPSRPTPVSEVLPFVLGELGAAGVALSDVRVVIATGTHGAPVRETVIAKVGAEAAAHIGGIHIHNHLRDNVRRGTTRFGTPVYVDRVVAASDFVIGIGGVYPQHTTWFGGGAKVLLGVLGERSIAHLHYSHWKLKGPYAIANEFRADLNEVARIVGLRSCISIHVDAARRPVRVVAGDPESYYEDAARFTSEVFRAPEPGDADIVISNAFPMDTSLTFAQSKGTTPLKHARASASKVLVGACPEGLGHHGLFPLFDIPRRYYDIQGLRRTWIRRSEVPGKIARRVRAMRNGNGRHEATGTPALPIRLYRPMASAHLPQRSGRMAEVAGWDQMLETIAAEQPDDRRLRAVVYPCAPLQVLDF